MTSINKFNQLEEEEKELAWLIEKYDKLGEQIKRIQSSIQKHRSELGIKNDTDLPLLDQALLKKEKIH